MALCGMFGYQSRVKLGNYPLKQIQFERCYELCAKMCKEYNIPINRSTVLTHYEFGLNHPDTTSGGKIDIIVIPYQPMLLPFEIGDFIRNKIMWYRAKN